MNANKYLWEEGDLVLEDDTDLADEFNPAQPRDPGGEQGGQWVKATAPGGEDPMLKSHIPTKDKGLVDNLGEIRALKKMLGDLKIPISERLKYRAQLQEALLHRHSLFKGKGALDKAAAIELQLSKVGYKMPEGQSVTSLAENNLKAEVAKATVSPADIAAATQIPAAPIKPGHNQYAPTPVELEKVAQAVAAVKLAKELAVAKAEHVYPVDEEKSFNNLAQLIGVQNAKAAFIHSKKLLPLAGEYKNLLKASEAAHILAYTGSGYREVNKALRNGVVDQNQYTHVKHLNRALDKLPAYKGEVTRRVPFDTNTMMKIDQLYPVGMIREERGFTSTSKDTDKWTGNVVFKIMSKSAGKDISRMSLHSNEQEVLFKSGTYFKVRKLSKDYGSVTVHLEEMEDMD